jgi:hypothetical protein
VRAGFGLNSHRPGAERHLASIRNLFIMNNKKGLFQTRRGRSFLAEIELKDKKELYFLTLFSYN